MKQYLSNRRKSESRKRKLEVEGQIEKRRNIDDIDLVEGEEVEDGEEEDGEDE